MDVSLSSSSKRLMCSSLGRSRREGPVAGTGTLSERVSKVVKVYCFVTGLLTLYLKFGDLRSCKIFGDSLLVGREI